MTLALTTLVICEYESLTANQLSFLPVEPYNPIEPDQETVGGWNLALIQSVFKNYIMTSVSTSSDYMIKPLATAGLVVALDHFF